ncbi:MAG: peptidoglycan DD-metalloendopeptidase family protein [Hyphomicrobium sp.]|nr:peptidoglycan DD-metalloendopeptidase family protein [Hyphomicrobium sp.]
MISYRCIEWPGRQFAGLGKAGLATMAAIGIAGCSADIARFDFPPSASFADGTAATGAVTTGEEAAFGRANLGSDAGPQSGAAPTNAPATHAAESRATNSNGIEMSALAPPPSQTPSSQMAPAQPSYAAPTPQAYTPPSPPPAAVAPIAPSGDTATLSGSVIEVQRGDTLFGLSKRHQVSLNELMRENGLVSPNLKPGQKLRLPGPVTAGIPTSPRQPEPTAPAVVADAPADWNTTYTVRPGDSLYAIARRHNTNDQAIARYNGIADVRRVKPGTVLRVPGNGSQIAEAAGAPPATSSPALPPVSAPITSAQLSDPTIAAPATTGPELKILNGTKSANAPPIGGQQSAAIDSGSKTDASAVVAPAQGSGSVADTGKLRWPVRGRIVAGFGPRTDGTHNDGINIAVPMGTDIHAAEDGVVAYAGDQLKGYGNLILVRHDGGIVTAYAHSSEVLVKRNDRVKRGQVIAKAGKTGHVDQPQVHFEVRKQERPVDPTPMLE